MGQNCSKPRTASNINKIVYFFCFQTQTIQMYFLLLRCNTFLVIFATNVRLFIIFFLKSVVIQLSMENFSITCTIEQGIVTFSLLWDADVIHVCPGIILYTVHARYTWVKARTVPLTFKLTKVKMHKTRWGNGLRVRN